MILPETFGKTKLGPDEISELKVGFIQTKADLNKYETINIFNATEWAKRTRQKDYLNPVFCRLLHRKMFDEVWNWAGEFRVTEKNIGVPHWEIGPSVKNIFDDVKYWITQGTYPLAEVFIRFHHRLVYIHLFPNGNGRHARLYADLLMLKNKRPLFTWGKSFGSDRRERYLAALRDADNKNYGPILRFGNS